MVKQTLKQFVKHRQGKKRMPSSRKSGGAPKDSLREKTEIPIVEEHLPSVVLEENCMYVVLPKGGEILASPTAIVSMDEKVEVVTNFYFTALKAISQSKLLYNILSYPATSGSEKEHVQIVLATKTAGTRIFEHILDDTPLCVLPNMVVATTNNIESAIVLSSFSFYLLGGRLFFTEFTKQRNEPSKIWLSVNGRHDVYNLKADESIVVDETCLIAYSKDMKSSPFKIGGKLTWFTGNKFMMKFSGPGKVITQSYSFYDLKKTLNSMTTSSSTMSAAADTFSKTKSALRESLGLNELAE